MFSATSPSPNAKALTPPPQAIDSIFGCEVFGHTGPKHSDRQKHQLSEHGSGCQPLPHHSLGRRSGKSCLHQLSTLPPTLGLASSLYSPPHLAAIPDPEDALGPQGLCPWAYGQSLMLGFCSPARGGFLEYGSWM